MVTIIILGQMATCVMMSGEMDIIWIQVEHFYINIQEDGIIMAVGGSVMNQAGMHMMRGSKLMETGIGLTHLVIIRSIQENENILLRGKEC